jgi:hypothetical protein
MVEKFIIILCRLNIYLGIHTDAIFRIDDSSLSATAYSSRDYKRPPMIRAAMGLGRIAKLGGS